MVKLKINIAPQEKMNVLCLGAHSDDIEIGCGGTLLKLISQEKVACIHWIVFSANKQREKEAKISAERFLEGANDKKIVIHHFRDGHFPYIGGEIKETFEHIKKEVSPDIIFTHYRKDLHQDHRTICELTLNTFRDHLIFEYEIPKYDGDIGNPNFYSCIEEKLCRAKIDILNESFQSQLGHQWFDDETFRSLMRLRGIEASGNTRYAEAFYCRKALF